MHTCKRIIFIFIACILIMGCLPVNMPGWASEASDAGEQNYSDQTLDLGDVTVSGMMPEGITAEAEDVSEEYENFVPPGENSVESSVNSSDKSSNPDTNISTDGGSDPALAKSAKSDSTKSSGSASALASSSDSSSDSASDSNTANTASAKTTSDTCEVIAAYDITLQSEGEEYQPAEDHPLQVDISSDAIADQYAEDLRIWHAHDDGTSEEVKDFTVKNGTLTFDAESFSAYIIVKDNEVVTPRVEFHFINSDFTTTENEGEYIASPYSFINKAGNIQTTQTLINGEGLEQIPAPADKRVDLGDDTYSERYFLGWYAVTKGSYDSNTDKITYMWEDEPKNVPNETAVNISHVVTADGTITVTWSVGGNTFSGTADETGKLDVYLAPLYDDYVFVNFHLNAKETSESSDSVLTRRFSVFGSTGTTTVRIGDVTVPSPDSQSKIFTGWKAYSNISYSSASDPVYYNTLDSDGDERDVLVDSDGKEANTSSGSGYIVTVKKVTEGQVDTLDLYPVFDEARWIYFDTNDDSQDPATYVSAEYLLTKSDETGTDNSQATYLSNFSDKIPTRSGYTFDGWYTAADDSGTQITDRNGDFVDAAKGQTFYDTDNKEKLWEITSDGELYLYNNLTAANGLKLYAHWTKNTVNYTVVFWLQDANDDNYSYAGKATKPGTAGEKTDYSVEDSDLPSEITNIKDYVELVESGDHAITQQTIAGDGSTIVNVYYDRKVYKLRFYYANSTTTTSGNWWSQTTTTAYNVHTNTGSYSSAAAGSSDETALTAQAGSNQQSVSTLPTQSTYEDTGTTTVTKNGTAYTYYYFDISAKYGADISSIWPSQPFASYNSSVTNRSGTSLQFISWASRNGSVYYADNTNKNIRGPYNTLDSSLIINTDNSDGNVAQSFLAYWNYPYIYTYAVYYSLLDGETADDSINDDGIANYATYDGVSYKLQTTYSVPSTAGPGGQNAPAFTGVTAKSGSPINANSASNGGTVQFVYSRNTHDLLFNVNYPTGANLTFSEESKSSNLTVAAPYGESLSGYKDYYGVDSSTVNYTNDLTAPDNYVFEGWYTDETCTVAFDFSAAMTDENKVAYAKWTPVSYRVSFDAAGGELAGASNQFTYTGVTYNTTVAIPTPAREYIPVSDSYSGSSQLYYYVNMQYKSEAIDGDGLPKSVRYAKYVAVDDDEASLKSLYNEYVSAVESAGGTVQLYETWKYLYVDHSDTSTLQKYRPLQGNENYTFLGWYQDGEDMQYNANDPVTEDFTLTARWELNGRYTLQYIPDYTMPDGTQITAEVDSPSEGEYNDGTGVIIYRQPSDIKANGTDTTNYIFQGWQLVSQSTDSVGNVIYTQLEDGKLHMEGDTVIVKAEYADTEGNIYLQAVYSAYDGSSGTQNRVPEIANLTLDANGGYVTDENGAQLDEEDTVNISWDGNGTAVADGSSDTLVFGNIDSNTAVDLNAYAVDTGNGNTMYFKHPDGYFLLGFDESPDENDYIATYPADSVISVQRTDAVTLYAVWEPMVYITFVNNTGVGDVDIGISADDGSDLEIINMSTGTYNREAVSDIGNITVAEGERIKLAIPQGAAKNITVSGTNTLGTGMLLSATSKNPDGMGSTQSRAVVDSCKNTETFTFNEELITDKDGIEVTFKARKNDKTLVLYDNYTGGSTQEIYFSQSTKGTVYYGNEDDTSYSLPTTSTRIGYEFAGWALDAAASKADYSTTSPADDPWNINNLTEFFNKNDNDNDDIVTLYAVWTTNTEAQTVYVYKNVPEPGDQTKDFTFTFSFSGSYTYYYGYRSYNRNTYSGSDTIDEQREQITLHHGQYFVVTTEKNVGNSATRSYLQAVIQKYNADGTIDGSATTLQWQWSNWNSSGWHTYYSDYITFGNLSFDVTETTEEYYDTSCEITGQASEVYPITNPQKNEIAWTDTDAGGAVVFTNTRQTRDVVVTKAVYPSANTQFSFSASYTMDGAKTTLDSFYLSANDTDGHTLSDIPVGAELNIAENGASDYTTAAAVDGKTVSMNSGSGTKSVNFTAAKNEDGSGAHTVAFTNTLKSYPVKFVKTDQNGSPGVQAAFSFNGYSYTVTDTDTGVFYTNDTLYAGTYTLTETWTQSGYRGLSAPVTLTVTGDEDDPISVSGDAGDTADVKITGDAEDGYTVQIINRATKTITVSKKLVDPMISQRTFSFNASYTMKNDGRSITTDIGTFTLTPTTSSDDSKELTVPVGASLIVKKTDSDLEVYDTTVSGNGGTGSSDGRVYNIDSVKDNAEITFTNTRKSVNVTVKKLVSGTGGSFDFNARVMNGSNLLTGYSTGEQSGYTAVSNGTADFTLKPARNNDDSTSIRIPYGAVITVSEAANDSYNTEVDGKKTLTYTSDAITEDTTITFTNTEIIVAPTNVLIRFGVWLALLAAGIALYLLHALARKRKEDV